MAMRHQEGEHHGPPPVPPEMVEILGEILEGGDLSGAAATMLGHLLMTPEEREDAGEPEIPEEEKEAAKEEIAEIFAALLEEEIPKPAVRPVCECHLAA